MDKALITTVAFAWVGDIADIDHFFVTLNKASRVFVDGRFGEFVRNGKHPNAEIEYAGDAVVKIPIGAICDMVEWKHPLFDKDQ